MSETIITAIVGFSGVVIGGLITFLSQLYIFRMTNKADIMAIKTVRYVLKHKKFAARTLNTIKVRLKGYSDDELRKLLIASGAVCSSRKDDEFWYLKERVNELNQHEKSN